jgi:hypothetical protein
MFSKEKTSTKKIQKIMLITIFFVIILFYLIPVPVNAYESPEYKDGLFQRWHRANLCIPCHYMLAGKAKAQGISGSCANCHQYHVEGFTVANDRKINMTGIENLHTDMVCIKCHAGSKSGPNITAADFHRIMSKTACMSCHTFENGTYIKPLKTKCSECHSGSPHVVHGTKLDKMCVACHGEVIGKFINTTPEEAANIMLISGQNTTIAQIQEYPSIGQFIIQLIEQFMKILR